MLPLRRKMIRELLALFTLPKVKEEVSRMAQGFVKESTRYGKGVTGEARETRDAFLILTRYIKREKVSAAEKRQFVRQMADLLKGTGVVVPVLLIPLPFVGTILLVIMDHLLRRMQIHILPSAFYPQQEKELLTPEAIERDLEKDQRGNRTPSDPGRVTYV